MVEKSLTSYNIKILFDKWVITTEYYDNIKLTVVMTFFISSMDNKSADD